MRFRYFDADGTEVRLSSVDALRFRIQTGAVSPETLLHDSAVGQWAPAGAHPVFRFLVEEDEGLLSPEQRELLDQSPSLAEAGEADLPDPAAVTGSPETGSDGAPTGAVDLAELEAILEGEPGGEADGNAPRPEPAVASDEAPLPEPASPSDEAPRPEPVAPTAEEPRAAEVAAGPTDPDRPHPAEESPPPASAGTGSRPVTPGPTTPATQQTTASPQPASASPQPTPRSPQPTPRSPQPTSSPSGGPSLSTPPPTPEETAAGAAGETGSRSRGQRRVRRRGVSALLVAGAAGAVVVLGAGAAVLASGSEAEGGVSPASLSVSDLAANEGAADAGASAPDRDESPATGSAETAGSPRPSGSAREEATRGAEARDVAALAEDVSAAATADLEEAMIDLRNALGVPESPPDIWLHGRYLSDAGAHPEVRAYWLGFSTLVSAMGELEEDLYRGFVRSRILGMRLDTATAAGLSAEALARYEAFGDRRRGAYEELSELGSLALALHDTLSARSADISFEPFDAQGLSRDPVIEAVAEDAELGEHVWGRLDRVFDLLEELQGLRPVSTSRLQAALLEGLPERTPPEI